MPIAGVTRTSHSDRQNHANRCAFLDFALGCDVAAVELHDVFDDREAETGAANAFGAARFVDAVETFKNTGQIFFADADAVVAYAQNNFFVALPSHQPDLA